MKVFLILVFSLTIIYANELVLVQGEKQQTISLAPAKLFEVEFERKSKISRIDSNKIDYFISSNSNIKYDIEYDSTKGVGLYISKIEFYWFKVENKHRFNEFISKLPIATTLRVPKDELKHTIDSLARPIFVGSCSKLTNKTMCLYY